MPMPTVKINVHTVITDVMIRVGLPTELDGHFGDYYYYYYRTVVGIDFEATSISDL